MTEKEKAEELVKKHLTAIAEESMDSDKMMRYSAAQCAIVSVDEIIRLSERADLFLMKTKHQLLTGFKPTEEYMEYWSGVKKELKNLHA